MVSKASKRRLMLLGTFSVMAIIYFCYVLIAYTTNIVKLSTEEKMLEAHLLSLKEEEENLKTEITKLNDPDYVARYARENFLYSKDGEYIIRIDGLNKSIDQEEINEQSFSLVILFSLFLIVLLVFILLKKKKKSK